MNKLASYKPMVACFIITAKHHDGFAMDDSKFSGANFVKATSFAPLP